MTNAPKTAAQLYDELAVAQDEHQPVARRYKAAEAAYRRSRSAKRRSEFLAAEHAMDLSQQRCDDLYATIAEAEAYEAEQAQDIVRAEREAAEPRFMF